MAIDSRADERWPDLDRVRRWGARGFWAITDQGLISLSNFVLNILLARWLTPADYGAFTVGFSVLLIIGSFHSALLTDPMLVFGAGRFAGKSSSYLRVLVLGHWVLTAPLALVALAVALGLRFWSVDTLSSAVLGLALAAPLYQLPMLLRRAFYVRMEPREAAAASGLYVAFSLVTAFALSRATNLSAASGFIAMTAGSVVSTAWLLLRLRVGWSIPNRDEISNVLSVHWAFSRWGLGVSVAWWVRSSLYYLILPISGGLEASAAFRAMVNLIMPLMQTIGSIGPLLLSAFAAARARADFDAIVRRVALLLGAGAVAYWVALGLFAEPILIWLYEGKYAEHGHLAWIIGLLPVCAAIGAAVGTALRALQRPDYDFWVTALSALAALTIGVLLVRNWGVAGAVAGWTLSYIISTVLMTAIFIQLRKGERDPEHGSK